MDFIEKMFGIAPDAGSGSLEAALVAAIATLVVALIVVRKRAAGSQRDYDSDAGTQTNSGGQ
jgi:hypothetical protein